MKKILDMFASYTEAYLEYKNNFVSPSKFKEFYMLDDNEFIRLVTARSFLMDAQSWREIDFFYNILLCLDNLKNGYGEPAEYDVQLGHIITRQVWVMNYMKAHGWKVTSVGGGQFSLFCK